MNLETSKNLGGIGAILLVIGFLGIFGTFYAGVLGLIGIILVLVAMKGLADNYNEAGIFNNTLYGFILTIVGGIAFVGTLVATFLMALTTLPITDWMNAAEWMEAFQEGFIDPSVILGLLAAIIAALVVLFVFVVISAIFYRKSLNLTAAKSGVGMFSTAGMILLIGAVLTIILIGFIIIWIAMVLLAVAFFSIKPITAAPAPPPPPS